MRAAYIKALAGVGWVFSPCAAVHVPVIYLAGPGDDWCQVIADGPGGDIVMLTPGD